jgi:hypothetical protein
MRFLETLKAVSLIGLAVALEVGFLLQASLPPAEVLRAAQRAAAVVETTVAQAPAAPAPPPAVAARRS